MILVFACTIMPIFCVIFFKFDLFKNNAMNFHGLSEKDIALYVYTDAPN